MSTGTSYDCEGEIQLKGQSVCDRPADGAESGEPNGFLARVLEERSV